jgi:serine protease inhibitor
MLRLGKTIVVSMVIAVINFGTPLAAFAKTKTDPKTLAENNNAFAFELYSKLQEQEGNLGVSPYSIFIGLAMLSIGARENTAAQIAHALHFSLAQQNLHPTCAVLISQLASGDTKGLYQLKVANALWAQKGYKFLNTFTYMLGKNYRTELHEVDFKDSTEDAWATLQAWVIQQTKNKITDYFSSELFDEETQLVLINAMYFNGKWANKFSSNQTKNIPFYLSKDTSIEVPIMHQKGNFRYGEDDGNQILELPYAGNGLSMLILLPREFDGLAALEKKLSPDKLRQWSEYEASEVDVYLPRFTITGEFSLKETLAALGVTDAFSEDADFSGMNGKKDLSLQAVLHKAVVEVREEGTKASVSSGTSEFVRTFQADHPFLFLIKENRFGSLLFIGRITKLEN